MSDVPSFVVMSMVIEPVTGHALAGTSQGLLRSADGGRTWTTSGDETPVMALANGAERGMLLAGRADGVVISHDAGDSWQSSLTSSSVSAVVSGSDAHGESVVLAGTERDGVYRSLDDGRSWQPALAGLRSLEVLCLAMSPDFAADNTVYAGTASGLHRSRNGGKAWRPVSLGVAPDAVQAIALAPDAQSIQVGTESRGLFGSADAGMTWAQVQELDDRPIGAITRVGGNVVVATEAAIWIGDAGQSVWRPIAEIAGVLCLLSIDERTVLVGTAGAGLLILRHDGGAWSVLASKVVWHQGRVPVLS